MRQKGMKRVAYLCLQATREGQASYAHVHEIIKGLRSRGWEIRLYEPAYAHKKDGPGLMRRLVEFVRVQLRLFLKERGKTNLIYIRWHFASWPTAFLARLAGIPVVQEINGPYADLFIAWPWTRRLSRFFIWLMRSQLAWADAVIAVTPQLGDWVRTEVGKDKVFVVPNGANTNRFHPGASIDEPVSLPPQYVIFFGALAPWQGIDVMLAAVADPAWPNDVSLVIVGDGAERPKVEAAAATSDRICYLGFQPYSTVPGLVARSLAALSPKCDVEGFPERTRTGLFPLKVFEALACGVPVIVTDFPGMSDLVRNGRCGLVVPPGNPKALAEAVAYLRQYEEERIAMGKRGRKLVEREHSWDRRAEQVATILDDILG